MDQHGEPCQRVSSGFAEGIDESAFSGSPVFAQIAPLGVVLTRRGKIDDQERLGTAK